MPEPMTPEALTAEGWTRLELDGFSRVAGGLWTRGRLPDLEIGFLSGPQHVNGHMRNVHGGMLLTLADVSLGYAVIQQLGAMNCVTAQLQTQFISAARVGEFIVCRPQVLRQSSDLVFLRGLVNAGERTVASVDGIWKILKPRG
jgi:acyl-coenzyme A thioesterase PaaI-like protein